MRKAISKELKRKILERDNYTCRYCGKKFPESALDIDHIRPVCLGGDNRESNLAAACFTCNRHKKAAKRFPEYEDKDSQKDFDENYRRTVREYGYYTNYIKKVFMANNISCSRPMISKFVNINIKTDDDFSKFRKLLLSTTDMRDICKIIVFCNLYEISCEQYKYLDSSCVKEILELGSRSYHYSGLLYQIMSDKKYVRIRNKGQKVNLYMKYFLGKICIKLHSRNFKIPDKFLLPLVDCFLEIIKTPDKSDNIFAPIDNFFGNFHEVSEIEKLLNEFLSYCESVYPNAREKE